MEDRFKHRPDVVRTFMGLSDPILRADYLRYLILLADGGLYTDIDTRAIKPIDAWVPREYDGRAAVVIGIEIDEPDAGEHSDWYHNYGFCQWTMMSKPGHALMQQAVDRVTYNLNHFAATQNESLATMAARYMDVITLTGPGVFTDIVFDTVNKGAPYPITWSNLTRISRPKLLGDVLVLPINGFGSGQSHSNSDKPEGGDALARHMFKGSWKSGRPSGREPTMESSDAKEVEKKNEEEEEKERQQQQQQR